MRSGGCKGARQRKGRSPRRAPFFIWLQMIVRQVWRQRPQILPAQPNMSLVIPAYQPIDSS